ncbi:DUF4625 domain-containing protein [Lentimicrobium sp. L6]|uniref:DUF4625 domain-containing protein n=1 Tax=Lentimicrobium sp. L6 TaxID=2735916 RepID=UPI0015550951|nr:DUF4625 domain-containing protein [Lentimicrobium sp. L6]NPD84091.1 DUF4625 domain-containing protein [Lentimicrobium sp. L6]
MKTFKYFIYSLLILFISISCNKDEDIDTEKPQIDNSFAGAFPMNCDTLYFGESFDLKVLLKDNTELGSYSISIHNNFDHHSHTTDVSECSLDPIKTPESPFVSIEDYSIPSGQTEYETNVSIIIPANSGGESFDEGDYHFFISLTDQEGWSAQKGMSIKMLYR